MVARWSERTAGCRLGWRTIVGVAAAAVTIAALSSLLSPAGASAAGRRSVDPGLRVLEPSPAAARALRARDLRRLRRKGIGGLVIDRRLRLSLAKRIVRRARRSGLQIVAPRRASRCRHRPPVLCARAASKPKVALRLARRGIVVAHVRRPRQLKRLRAAKAGSVIAIAPPSALGSAAWRRAMRAADGLPLGIRVRSRKEALRKGARLVAVAPGKDAPARRSPDSPVSGSGPAPPRLPDLVPASVFVSASGLDANACSLAAPCASFDRAYRAARPGEVVEVAGGTYPAQTIVADASKTSAERVVFRPAAGASVVLRGLKLGSAVTNTDGPRNLEIRDMRVGHPDGRDATVLGLPGTSNVVWRNLDAANFYLNGVKNFTVRGGDWGPCLASGTSIDGCGNSKIDGNSAPYGNENVVIDGAYFHDYRIVLGSGAHFECMFLNGGRNITVRNSRFEDCAFYDIFVARRTGDAFDGLTIENNWFDTPWTEATGGPSQTRPGAVEFSHGGDLSEPWKNVLVRFNSFHASTGVNWNVDGGDYSSSNNRVIGNIMRNQSCDSRFSSAYNLVNGPTCSATDRNIGSSFPYSNPGHLQNGGDWHLAGSSAIDVVPTGHADTDLGDDIDRNARPRGNGRDAGADEAG